MGARWNQTSLCINVYVCTCNRVRVRMVVRVYVCVWECVRDRRVTWSPRDFVSATWSLSANVLALVCRPKERDEDVPVHKWIFEVKIEGSASFRLKHDRLRHRCIAARLKYPRVTRYTHTHTHTLSLSLSLFLYVLRLHCHSPSSLASRHPLVSRYYQFSWYSVPSTAFGWMNFDFPSLRFIPLSAFINS